jgi:hypothetical protein
MLKRWSLPRLPCHGSLIVGSGRGYGDRRKIKYDYKFL